MPASHAGARLAAAMPRLAAVFLAVACLGTAASGCTAFNRVLGQRWAEISFRQGTPVPVILRTMTACSHIRNVVPEPLPAARQHARFNGSVQYRIDKATDAQLALLQVCVQRFPSFAGLTFRDVSGQ